MPAVGHDLSQVLGNVMFNYTLANTVPSWVNTKHKSVPIAKSIWTSIWIATFAYLFVGWFGGAAFPMPGSNLLSAIQSSDRVSAAGHAVNDFITITYPILVLLTSIPVSMIIVKLNLSVIEELEFLELEGNLRKYREDDDDFDYVYHLPYADLSRLGTNRYNPFKGASQVSLGGGPMPAYPTQPGGNPESSGSMMIPNFNVPGGVGRSMASMAVSGYSNSSGPQSRRQLMRQMLGPGAGSNPKLRGSRRGSAQTSRSNMGQSMMGGTTGLSLAVPQLPSRRPSMFGGGSFHNPAKIHPITDLEDVEAYKGTPSRQQSMMDDMKPPPMVVDLTGDLGNFKALPPWVTRRVHPNVVAMGTLLILAAGCLIVAVMDIVQTASGAKSFL
ncbi:hypothetical protein HK104_005027 [Borealophlyctis nickersoniae]|nr:hypothetical protein HK104_005027 [Borealophlyctis nickersoniae]